MAGIRWMGKCWEFSKFMYFEIRMLWRIIYRDAEVAQGDGKRETQMGIFSLLQSDLLEILLSPSPTHLMLVLILP